MMNEANRKVVAKNWPFFLRYIGLGLMKLIFMKNSIPFNFQPTPMLLSKKKQLISHITFIDLFQHTKPKEH